MTKPGILVITSSFPKREGDPNGGFVYELSSRLAQEFSIFILTPHSKGLCKKETMGGITIYRHKQFFWSVNFAYGVGIYQNLQKYWFKIFLIPFFLFYQLISIKKIVKQEKIELLHAHWILPNGFTAIIYKTIFNPRIKVLATIHGSDFWGFRNFIGNSLKRFCLRNIDRITVVSQALKEEVIKLGYLKPVPVCSMGVDTKKFSPLKKDLDLRKELKIFGAFLLFVGILVEAKGIRLLINAMPHVLSRFPETKLVVIGDGTLKQEMIELANVQNIQESIIFLGELPHDELPRYYATADLFILPSESEGWPVVVMEALSSGTPCLVSDIPAFKEIDYQNPFIIKSKVNDKNELGSSICKTIISTEHLKNIRESARIFALNKMDWNEISFSYCKIINEMNK